MSFCLDFCFVLFWACAKADLGSEVTCVNEKHLTERLVYTPTDELAEFACYFSFVVCFGVGWRVVVFRLDFGFFCFCFCLYKSWLKVSCVRHYQWTGQTGHSAFWFNFTRLPLCRKTYRSI